MKYRLMQFEGDAFPSVKPATVFVIPVSSAPDEYRVIYPSNLTRDILQLLYYEDLVVRKFAGCSEEALYAVKQKLTGMLHRRVDELTLRGHYMVMGGVGLFVLGIISWVSIPDPLPFVDEIAFSIGGALMAYFGLKFRREKLPVYRDTVRVAEQNIDDISTIDDPFLSRIYESIQGRQRLVDSSDLDQIEAESRRLADFIDVKDIIGTEQMQVRELKKTISSIQDVIPLKRMGILREKTGGFIARHRLNRIRGRMRRKCGLSDEVMAVYSEFYRSAREYLLGQGEDL